MGKKRRAYFKKKRKKRKNAFKYFLKHGEFPFEKETILKDRHHRKPKSKGGCNNDANISVINIKKHRAWHVLFKNYDPQDIVGIIAEINKVYLDPDYKIILVYNPDTKLQIA